MPRTSRRKQDRSTEDIARGILAILFLVALGIGGIGGFASALVGLFVILITLAVAGGLIYLVVKSHLVTLKKWGFSLIVIALLVGFYWNSTRLPDEWPEIQASVMGPMGKGDSRVVKINVGNVFAPKFIDIRGPGTEDLKTGDKISVWVDPVTRNEFSLTPRQSEAEQSYTYLFLACLVGAGGIGLLFVDKKWMAPPEVIPVEASAPSGSEASHVSDEKPSTPSIADRLVAIDWFQFEKVVKRVLEADGWQVEHRGGAHADGGADLQAVKTGRTAIVQCKHWRSFQVNVKVVRELLGAKDSAQFRADGAMLFTIGECTQPTREFAQQNHIEIFDKEYLRGRIAGIGVDSFPELLHPETKFCPKCGAPMVWRANAAKPFWGCSNFPRTHCHGKIEES